MAFEIVTNVGGVRIVEMLRDRVANHVFLSNDHERGLRHEQEQPNRLERPDRHVWQAAVGRLTFRPRPWRTRDARRR